MFSPLCAGCQNTVSPKLGGIPLCRLFYFEKNMHLKTTSENELTNLFESMSNKSMKKRNTVIFSVPLPIEHDDLVGIVERFVQI